MTIFRLRNLCNPSAVVLGSALLAGLAVTAGAAGPFGGSVFLPGKLVVSRSVYDNNANNIAVGTVLPPNCASTKGGCAPLTAQYNGTYPTVWNNNLNDGSFGITSKIFLDQITPDGTIMTSLEVPNSSQPGITATSDQLVTSFPSKSEMALNLSTDGTQLIFIGYVAPIDAIDVSNSNTPTIVDPTNPVGLTYDRAVAEVDQNGHFQFTTTNAYSGNNGRAAILNSSANLLYTAGNAGNGSNPQPNGILLGAGAQILTPANTSEAAQSPGTPTPVGSFNITQLGNGQKADKIGKDDNFRGMTIFNNVLYFTKGSGGNGVNTVYFVDTTTATTTTTTTPAACPNGGSGLPATFATLPVMPLPIPAAATLAKNGLPSNMCILAGFPTVLAKNTTGAPFGLWFANDHTLYVADEGDGFNNDATLYAHAAGQTKAGLQKWVFDSIAGAWKMVYTLQTGLGLGVPYTVANYPSGNNPATGLPWAPATDGLRNITGRTNGKGSATIYAITSTVSGNGDQGADPNRLVVIMDNLKNTDPAVAAAESFVTVRTAGFGEVLRGVSFTPGTK